jgi:hypothetical protein
MSLDEHVASRRKFPQFLAASPLFVGSDLAAMATIKHLVPAMVRRA